MEQSFPTPKQDYLVVIISLVYNQEGYIRDTLDGFIAQRTNFPFCAVVMDDCSTDKTAEIIKSYEAKYPDIIKGIYLPENYYSQNKNKMPILQPWHDHCKYLAICEGDDYWIDPKKLQKQVDWLEANPDYTMCCSDSEIIPDEEIWHWHRYSEDCDIPVEDMVSGGGLWVQTPTLVFRKDLYKDFPDCCWKCHVADYPIQIWATLKGKVRYLKDRTSCYRLESAGSWSSRQLSTRLAIAFNKSYRDLLIHGWETEIAMLKGLDEYSKGKYHDVFLKRKAMFIWGNVLKYRINTTSIKSSHPELFSQFSKFQKFIIFILQSDIMCIIFGLPFVDKIIRAEQIYKRSKKKN